MKEVLENIGFYVGTIVGAGMFALPYAVIKAGPFWSLLFFFLTFGLLTLFHLIYGRIAYAIEGKHRLPGHVREVFGKNAALVATFAVVIGLYGALLVYGILSGIFLHHLTSALTPSYWTIIFFICLAPMLLFRLERIGIINFVLSIPIVLFVILLFVKALPIINVSYLMTPPALPNYFLPYGVFLFAFAGLSAIPEMVEVMRKHNRQVFTRIVIGGSLAVAVIYALFVIAIAGVAGSATAPDALSTLPRYFSTPLVVFGELVALLAVLTSYLAIGIDLRGMFHYDYNFSPFLSWLFVISIPLFLFVIGFGNFISIVEFLGAVTVALNGMFVLWLAVRKNIISSVWALPLGVALLLGIGLFIVS
jgi:amino acid permease